jgi:spermidine synthase
MVQFDEALYDVYRQSFSVDEIYFERKTEHQHLIIFRNGKFGRVMALDGIVQTTEADEFIYHEMMTHVPILAHGEARRVLIVGGGDGGILREVARHSAIESIRMVEIDRAVVDMCREYLPKHSAGAFDDPRLELIIADGAEFVASDQRTHDVIIVDSTDPIGPGEVLFEDTFYGNCKRLLSSRGVLVTQNGVAFMQPQEATSTARAFSALFTDSHFYHTAVPTYVGGSMLFGWGAMDAGLRQTPVAVLEERFANCGIATRYYTPQVHFGSFALPRYVLDEVVNVVNRGPA